MPEIPRGSIDETARNFLEHEKAIAQYLAERGSVVRALAESGTSGRRQPDAEVDGIITEFKTFPAEADSYTVLNSVQRSVKRGGQARSLVADARGTSLSEEEARRAFARIAGLDHMRGKLDRLRIIGNSFDIEHRFEW